ncbi:MAG: N-acetylmuramoyl-L-alanine amidase [Lachnospiraceae bacterium]|nr:N-acetylmuramoyl-L-alanine amidase [Lachnospiraceae bacterium]
MKKKGRWKSVLAAAFSIAFMMAGQVSAASDTLVLPAPEALIQTSDNMAVDGDGTSTIEQTTSKVETIILKSETDTMVLGKQYQLTYSCYPKSSQDAEVYWMSSNSLVASVDSQGIVSAGKVGSAKITVYTADNSSVSDSFTVKVIKEKVVILDPGHGGQDSGAVSKKYNLVERNMNLDIALACKAELEKYDGIQVYLTRTTNSSYPSLSARPKLAYDKKADLFVSLHINDGASYSNGAEVYQSVNGRYKVTNLSRNILRNLSSLGVKNRGVKTRASSSGKDYYAVIRGSVSYGIPGIIVEHGFINHSKDAACMDTRSERQKMGQADAKAIADYFGLTEKGYAISSSASAMVYVTGVKASASTVTLTAGKSKTMKMTVTPSNATNTSLSWKSSNSQIAKVSSTGKITAQKTGVTYVTAKAKDGSGEKARIKVVVKRAKR